MNKDEALKMAIKALEAMQSEAHARNCGLKICDDAIPACKEALEQPAQEPVAWIKEVELFYIKAHKDDNIMNWKTNLGLKPEPDDAPLYTHPHQWQGLTDDEIEKLGLDLSNPAGEFVGLSDWKIFARAIEQALKEKNSV
jgi:hypothetical protein